jgi:hypothetical protein
MSHHPESRRLLVEMRLTQLLLELGAGWPDQCETVEVRGNGLVAVLRIGPPCNNGKADDGPRDLTPCQRDVLAVVRAECEKVGHGVQGAAVRAALPQWGASTVNVALSDLKTLGLLVNHNDKRGYSPTPDAEPS